MGQKVNQMCIRDRPVAEALIKTTGGVGPVVGREAAYRAFGGRDVTASRKMCIRDRACSTVSLRADGQPRQCMPISMNRGAVSGACLLYTSTAHGLAGHTATVHAAVFNAFRQ